MKKHAADGYVDKTTTAVVAALAAFIAPFMSSSINIALPSIGRDFRTSALLLGWVATSFILATALCLIPFGRLADLVGRKKVFFWGVVVNTVASVLCAVSGSVTVLIVFRIIQGVGSSMIFGTATAILTSVYPPSERGKALGLNTAAVYLGLSLGPVLGGVLTQQLGWRSIFWVNLPVGCLILGLVLWKVKGDWAEAKGERFDGRGSALFGMSLALMMYGFTRLPGGLGTTLLLAGLAGLALFIRLERRVEHPVLDVRLFARNRVFAFSNLAALINYSATSAVGFLLSLYLQYIKGMKPQEAGLVLIAQPVMMMLFSPLAGKLSDRIEPRILASAGMAITSAGLILLIFLNGESSIGFIAGSLMLLGFGFALFSSPNTNAVMGSVEKKCYGVASATLATMRFTGGMASLGIAMLLFSLFIGRRAITPEFHPHFLRSVHAGFIVFAALCLAGVFASLTRGNRSSCSPGPS